MRTLYITNSISHPLSYGGEIRRWNVLQGLLGVGDVDVMVFTQAGKTLTPESFIGCGDVVPLSEEHITFAPEHDKLYQSTVGRGILTLGYRRPYQYLGARQAELQAQVQHQLQAQSYDLVWFNTARLALAVGPLKQVPTVLDGDDFDYVRESLLLRTSPWYGAKLWNYLNLLKLWYWERRLGHQYGAVARCSQEDCNLHPGRNVVVIPNGACIPATIHRAPEPRFLFVGMLGYAPNSIGLSWFLKSVWPGIRQAIPHAQLDIVGRQAPESLMQWQGREGVTLHGFVEDLAPLYSRATASIVPLLAGGGTRLKILESLAYQVPVLATPIGAFGISADEAEGLYRANDATAFVQRGIAMLRDPLKPTQQAEQGRCYVQEHFDWERIQTTVGQLAVRVAGKPFATQRRRPELTEAT